MVLERLGLCIHADPPPGSNNQKSISAPFPPCTTRDFQPLPPARGFSFCRSTVPAEHRSAPDTITRSVIRVRTPPPCTPLTSLSRCRLSVPPVSLPRRRGAHSSAWSRLRRDPGPAAARRDCRPAPTTGTRTCAASGERGSARFPSHAAPRSRTSPATVRERHKPPHARPNLRQQLTRYRHAPHLAGLRLVNGDNR
jgi:hypothetical protein